jgi:hypothetical protein
MITNKRLQYLQDYFNNQLINVEVPAQSSITTRGTVIYRFNGTRMGYVFKYGILIKLSRLVLLLQSQLTKYHTLPIFMWIFSWKQHMPICFYTILQCPVSIKPNITKSIIIFIPDFSKTEVSFWYHLFNSLKPNIPYLSNYFYVFSQYYDYSF